MIIDDRHFINVIRSTRTHVLTPTIGKLMPNKMPYSYHHTIPTIILIESYNNL